MPHLVRSLVVRGSLMGVLAGCTATAPRPEEAAPGPQPVVAVEAVKPAEAKPVEAKAPEPPGPVAAPAPVDAIPAWTLEGAIGVAACDDYVTRYRACIERNLWEGDRAAHMGALIAQATAWTAAKADPKLAPALAGECAAALVAARAATRVFGCVWRDGDSPEPERPKGGKPRGVERGLDDPFEPY